MRDAAPRRSMPFRLTSLLAVVAVTLAGSLTPSLPGQAADPPKQLTPQERQKLEAQASELNEVGYQAYQQGDLVKAVAKIRELLQIREKLYSNNSYPQGHPELAEGLNAMGFLLQAQGSYVEARGYLERALLMRQSLYSKDRYPQGHPDLATSLNNLGGLISDQGSYGEARGYHERSLAMRQSLYPKDRYPPWPPPPGHQPDQPGLPARGPGVVQ